jgi:hypothetical protein
MPTGLLLRLGAGGFLRGKFVMSSDTAKIQRLTGQCLCGAVRYSVANEFLYAANCHCSNCRRATGSAFKPFAGIERSKLSLVEGKNSLIPS